MIIIENVVIENDESKSLINNFKKNGVRILKTLVAWIVTLTALIIVEAGFKGTSWLSETILIPLIVFQVISALKNAEQAGFIKNEALTTILDKIDKHKEK